MRCLRVAACLVALIFSLSSMAMGAEVTYSGIPGKWKRGTKETKAAAADPKPRDNGPKNGTKKIIDNDKLKVTVGPKKG